MAIYKYIDTCVNITRMEFKVEQIKFWDKELFECKYNQNGI